jgi:threonine/homoserine/homoserine lactone efflux protein
MEIEQSDESIRYTEESSEESPEPEDSVQEEPEQYEQDLESMENNDQKQQTPDGKGRSSFIDGLAVGLGIGSIASFAIVWVSLFFSPLLPQSATYESLLATFIYPLIYLLAIGLVALTAGVVREYYSKTKL